MTIGTIVFLGVGKGQIGVEVGDSAYDESGNDKIEQNIENKRNPPTADSAYRSEDPEREWVWGN